MYPVFVEELRSHEPGSSNAVSRFLLSLLLLSIVSEAFACQECDGSSESKVSDFDVVGLVKETVLRLQVSVHDGRLVVMEIVDASGHLDCDVVLVKQR